MLPMLTYFTPLDDKKDHCPNLAIFIATVHVTVYSWLGLFRPTYNWLYQYYYCGFKTSYFKNILGMILCPKV